MSEAHMTTSIEEALRSGAVRLVPVEATHLLESYVVPPGLYDHASAPARGANSLAVKALDLISASPDHTPALIALIEELRAENGSLRKTIAAEAQAGEEWRSQCEIAEAERDRLKVERDIANDAREAHAACTAALIAAAEGQLDAVEKAMGVDAVRFMDPPDGGDPTLAEMVGNMRRQLDSAEARALTQETNDGE